MRASSSLGKRTWTAEEENYRWKAIYGLSGSVAAGGASPAHGPQDAPYHIKFPGRGISRQRKELV